MALPLLPSGTVLMSCPKVAAFNRTRSTTCQASQQQQHSVGSGSSCSSQCMALCRAALLMSAWHCAELHCS